MVTFWGNYEGISQDRASEDRIKPVKRKIKEFFEHFDLLRVSCIYKGEIDSLLSIIREFYGVK